MSTNDDVLDVLHLLAEGIKHHSQLSTYYRFADSRQELDYEQRELIDRMESEYPMLAEKGRLHGEMARMADKHSGCVDALTQAWELINDEFDCGLDLYRLTDDYDDTGWIE